MEAASSADVIAVADQLNTGYYAKNNSRDGILAAKGRLLLSTAGFAWRV